MGYSAVGQAEQAREEELVPPEGPVPFEELEPPEELVPSTPKNDLFAQ